MKSDDTKDVAPDTVSADDQQNRREFFNGLGKWSMIVVAAVSLLRASITRTHASREGTTRPEWNPADPSFPRYAKKKHRQHVDVGTGHMDSPHGDVAHVDRNVIMQ